MNPVVVDAPIGLNREIGEWGTRDPHAGSQPRTGIHPGRSERLVGWRNTVTGVPSERVEVPLNKGRETTLWLRR